MGFWNWKCLFLSFLLVAVSFRNGVIVEASSRPFSIFPIPKPQKGFKGYYNSKIFAIVGIECKCCDGIGGKCSTEFTISCSNLHCSPWKQY
ncbi:unnamed protein product [Citrullus colocynthis]|uniref:Uncharacterized protein n=1 Tax=Citrullus colocynthis TaxID=252529 RepID=A0ABP0YJ03_9ROSI